MDATRQAEVLLLVGTDHLDKVRLEGGKAHVTGSTDLVNFLLPGEYHRLHIRPDLLKQGRRPILEGYRHIVNCVTEAERSPQCLDVIRRLLKGVNATVINRPEAILRTTRDHVARRLAGIDGLIVPRVHRFRARNADRLAQALDQSGIRFPLIMRRPGTHGGEVVGRFETIAEAMANMGEGGEYLVTEFHDFRSEDGLYRKARVYYLGGRRVFRHRFASDHWNVHFTSRDSFMAGRPDVIAEEAALFERPEGAFPESVGRTLDGIYERMGLDFFGIDFAVQRDGQVLLFETNATMNFFSNFRDPRFPAVAKAVKPAGDAFRAMLHLPPLAFATTAPTNIATE
jgi:hypothetical protein